MPNPNEFTSKMVVDRARGVIVLKNVRLSYPALFRPKSMTAPDGKQTAPKYGAVFITHLPNAERDELLDLITHVFQSKCPGKTLAADKKFARRGDDTGKPEYAGAIVISASESVERPPKVYNRAGKITASEAEVYSGCMVDAVIRPWAQDNQWGKRVNASLVAVKFVGDNEPFGLPPIDDAELLGVEPGQAPVVTAPAAAPAADTGYQSGPYSDPGEVDPWG